jgi:hypothetical protein
LDLHLSRGVLGRLAGDLLSLMTATQRCRQATARLAKAEADRLQAMKDMHAEGATLVEIAKAAGMSDPGVLKALRRAGVDTSRTKQATEARND